VQGDAQTGAEADLVGRIVSVRITSATEYDLWGALA
jgi:tRNA A37 methylthiotransferase MiaB